MSPPGGYLFRVAAALGLEGPEAATLWEHGCRGVMEEGEEIVGYFDERLELPLAGSWQESPEDDYLERYYQGLDAVAVGTLVVVPTHRRADLTAGQKPLWLDPGMAFGTGHHETTRLALEALERLDPGGKTVLDVGSGSGILAIAADLLGAASALGIDIDRETVTVARANAALNRSRAIFEHATLTPSFRADLVLANLTAELHVELAAAYPQSLLAGGILIATGVLADRKDLVDRALAPSFGERTWRPLGEWLLVEARR